MTAAGLLASAAFRAAGNGALKVVLTRSGKA
jgi:hypothetical protein